MSIYTNPMVIRNQKTRIDTQTLEGSSILLIKSSNHKEKNKKKKWKEKNYSNWKTSNIMALDTYFSLATLNVNVIRVGKDVEKMDLTTLLLKCTLKKKKIYIEAATMKNSMEVPQKLKTELSYVQQFHRSIYLEKNENYNLKRYMHYNVQSSTIYKSQVMETILVSIYR